MRSLLITQADDEAALAAALASEADAIVIAIDLAPNAREAARANAARLLAIHPKRRVLARVDALGEADDDLDAAMAFAPAAILLQRSAGAASVQRLSSKLAVREAQLGLPDGAIQILALINSAEAALSAPSLVRASARLAGLAFLADSLGAEVGADMSSDGASGAVAQARAITLLAATAARVPAFDTTTVASGERLRAEALAARRDGFAGKLIIEPDQAPIVNAVFDAKLRPRFDGRSETS